MGADGLTGSGYLACLPFTRVTCNHVLKCKNGEVGERGESNSDGNALQQTAVLYIHPPHPSQAECHPISGWRSQVPPSFHCVEGWVTFNQAAKGSYCSLLGRSLNYRFTHPGSGKEPSVHRSESWSLLWALPRNG